MMATTGPESESRASPGLETGCTANPTTTAHRCTPPEPRAGTSGRAVGASGRLRRGRADGDVQSACDLMAERVYDTRKPMTLRRATLYAGGASLLIAWFSSAASLSLDRNRPRPAAAVPDAAALTDGVAGHIQAQARRLRDRMAAAPLPQRP